jgi:hypothetical protein
LGSRGAGVGKLETGEWFTGPDWLLDERQWPEQPDLKSSKKVNSDEHKPFKDNVFYNKELNPDEWTMLLTKNKY